MALNQMIERGRAASANRGAVNVQSGLLLMVAGILLGGTAIYISPGGKPNPVLVTVAGSFILLGIAQFMMALRAKAK